MYLRFTRFLLPLILTTLILEFGSQVVNAGMARMPDATRVLGAFGLAWGLVTVLSSPLGQVRYAGMVLIEGREDFRRGLHFVAALALTMMTAQWILGGTAVSSGLLEGLHGVAGDTADMVRVVMVWLLPMPLLRGVTQLCSGVLTRGKRTGSVSAATALGVGAGFAAVLLLLRLDAVRSHPIWLPILVLYASSLTECCTVLWFLRGFAASGQLDRLGGGTAAGSARPPPLTGLRRFLTPAQASEYAVFFRFTWPVALMTFMQEFSRPLINLFVVRGANGAEEIAALTVAYTLGQWSYRWLNELRALMPPFYPELRSYRPFFRYTYACGLVAFASCLLLFWTPLRTVLLEQAVGLSPVLAELSRAPLQIYAFFPFVVVHRAYFHSISFLERRTLPMAVTAPMRVGAILVALLLLPLVGVHGAARGVGALLAGFAAETVTIGWMLLGREQLRVMRRRQAR